MVFIFSYYHSSCQVKDRQKKKQLTKGIRVDAEGDASLEDLTDAGSQATGCEPTPDPERSKSSNKKVLKWFRNYYSRTYNRYIFALSMIANLLEAL